MKTQASVVVAIIFLLIGSVVLFNSHSFSQKNENTTSFVTVVDTNTVYVTTTVSNEATSTVFEVPPTTTSTLDSQYTLAATSTNTESQIIRQAADPQNGYILVGGQNGT